MLRVHGSEGWSTSYSNVAFRQPFWIAQTDAEASWVLQNNNNNNRRLVTLAEHTSDHGRQTNSSTEEKGEQLLGAKAKSYRLKN